MPTKRRVVVGPQEEARMRRAEALKAAGDKSFEAVYGSTEPGSFSAAEDLSAIQEVAGMAPNPEVRLRPEQPVTFDRVEPVPQPRMAPKAAAPTVQPQAPEQPAAEVPAAEQPAMELSTDPDKRAEQVVEILRQIHPNPPSAEMLKQWKQIHGEIYITNIESYVFIYRYLKRQEHIQILANPRINEMQDHQVEEMLFDRCVVWPTMDPIRKAGLPAGAMNAIVAQIKMHSMFLDPAYVAQMTLKL
jgi:hypothetical protein